MYDKRFGAVCIKSGAGSMEGNVQTCFAGGPADAAGVAQRRLFRPGQMQGSPLTRWSPTFGLNSLGINSGNYPDIFSN